jgi:hypothetical protein
VQFNPAAVQHNTKSQSAENKGGIYRERLTSKPAYRRGRRKLGSKKTWHRLQICRGQIDESPQQ